MNKSLKWSVGSLVKVISAIILVSMFAAPTAYAQPDYVRGDASATPVTDEGFEAYWRYCISTRWDVSQYPDGPYGASHVSIILGLDECIGDCGDVCFIFPDTVGVSDGIDGCSVYYYAELDLKGDPTVPPAIPTLKFEPYPADCEPDVAGTATVCFCSLIPPRTGDSSPSSVWIKFGPYAAEGLISGSLPGCRTTAYDGSTWGSVKRLFR